MAKINLLSDKACRAAKYTGGTETRYLDGGGLVLVCTKAGGKRWRWWSRVDGKIVNIALGAYPDLPLEAARRERDRLNQLKEAGIHPAEDKRDAKEKAEAEDASFEAVAREWYGKKGVSWSASHREKVLGRLVANAFPALGKRPIGQITPPELLAVMQAVEQRSVDGAHRLLQTCGQIFRYGLATGRCERDPAADLKGALVPLVQEHFAAIVNPKQLAPVLAAMWDYRQGSPSVRAALRLTPMLAVRQGELRQMEWTELDLDVGMWSIPGEKMKMKQPHLVPLARQAVAVLQELQPLTGHGRHVFANPRSPSGERPMSENAVRTALRTLGFDNDTITPHGFRATFRTIGAEVLEENPLVLEAQLAHRVPDALGTAYNRTSYLSKRKVFMQRWADYLDQLRGEGKN